MAASSRPSSGSSASHFSATSRDSRRERLTEYLASRRVDASKSSITSSRPTSHFTSSGMSKVTMDRLNRAKASAPPPPAHSSRHEKNDAFGGSKFAPAPEVTLVQAKPTVQPTTAPNLSTHSAFSTTRKPTMTHQVSTEPPAYPEHQQPPTPPSNPATSSTFDDDDSFGPMKLTFDSTPPRKPKSSQPPGLLSHFKAKKTPTAGSAQKSLSFNPPSFPQEENQDETDRLPSSTFASLSNHTNSVTPSSHFKNKLHLDDATPRAPTATAAVPSSHFKKPKTPAALPTHTYDPVPNDVQSPQATTVRDVVKSHFKQKPPKELPAPELVNAVARPDPAPSVEQPPPSHFKARHSVLRKSPTLGFSDNDPPPASAIATTVPSRSPSSFKAPSTPSNLTPDAAATPFPRQLQEPLRQLLDDAIYTSKFSLAGARVVFADIPSRLPLAPQKAIFWLAKASVEEQHKAWTTATDVYTEALHVLTAPLERLIVEAALMEFQSRLQVTQQPPVNIVVPNKKTELTPEKQREFCAHLLEGTHEESFIMSGSAWSH